MVLAHATSLATRPSLIEWANKKGRKLSFLIMDAPKAHNLQLYLKECKRHNVVSMVRVCEDTYPAEEVTRAGIDMHHMEYPDGDAPPQEIINQWLDVVDVTFSSGGSAAAPVQGTCCCAAAGASRASFWCVLTRVALDERCC
eukprot:TRINITY_DN12086_c0_g1_i1.p1 TRINITY_DN12086_c0_g1~~TRINITY_DN12086_c0_g1_i1.p1  ORF type:complete len:142 (-),score=57.25 TRINITY_DN12086_c0_g1_i1:440-865(-)